MDILAEDQVVQEVKISDLMVIQVDDRMEIVVGAMPEEEEIVVEGLLVKTIRTVQGTLPGVLKMEALAVEEVETRAVNEVTAASEEVAVTGKTTEVVTSINFHFLRFYIFHLSFTLKFIIQPNQYN